jgi:segregation and condensation protein A
MNEAGPAAQEPAIEVETVGRAVSDADPASPAETESGDRFPVDVPGFRGELEELVHRVQRGDVDITGVPIAEITDVFRRRVGADPALDPREVADFLTLAGRLLTLKTLRLLPDGPLEAFDLPMDGEPADATDDPGARLAEYRLFRAAAEALLSEPAEEGQRSFAGAIAASITEVERLSIAPERLAAAFRAILERLPEPEALVVDAVTFSVDDKVAAIRALLADRSRVPFDEVFASARSRLEAVACFLALLELVKTGEARVAQRSAFDAIEVLRARPEPAGV